ncbi:hypothetical protein COU57_02150 [Candidatus Pacearchaeota archaeon CG10_big_fil_rev_8_21_14_0_10_32_14]|nr:MAG: hypothetical protein COU57_02150 [Candidatus Pacearchaeota archaeon CG10_big_fil_rev_8_21_14_0_10_32_14]
MAIDTDMGIAVEIGYHIDNPCGCEVNGEWENIRPFYMRIAQETIPNLTNPFAIDFLEAKLREYST